MKGGRIFNLMQPATGGQVSLVHGDDAREKFLVELVVARHEEDLRWLRRVPEAIRISIYNKGTKPALPERLPSGSGVRVLDLPNFGREAHSYLKHLVESYDRLSPVTVFCQGHPFDHAPDFHERLRALAEQKERTNPFLWYGFMEETDDAQGRRLFVPWSKNPDRRELSTGSIYQKLFGGISPQYFHFRGGAQFAVSREAVRLHPREFYRTALEISLEVPDAAHSLERMWDQFFGDPVINPSDLGTEGVRYLKKIRRLSESGEKSDSLPT